MIFSDFSFDVPDNINDEKLNVEVAQNALICIAQELKRFQAVVEDSSVNGTKDDDLLSKLYICSTKLQSKNKQLKKLHRNLKMACTVAKTLMSAKNKESKILEYQLNMKRKECVDLLNTRTENISLIENLQTENATVYQEVEKVSNIIYLGYKEVQKMRHETPKDVPVLVALKEILMACGQYYVNFSNDRERCSQLEQKNRFLKNKIIIMENDLAACKEEIRNLKNLNMRLTRSRELKNLEQVNASTHTSINDDTSPQLPVSKCQLNIASHLSAVRDLLSNQDSMLRDLRKLSEKLGA